MDTSRREFLRLAGAACVPALDARTAKACIVVWTGGGLSHLDTFDMKPEAPREIRGEFRPMATSAAGIRISEHLPRTARIAHKLTILRSMHASETNHERALRTVWNSLGERRVTGIGDARRAVEEGAGMVVADLAGTAGRCWDTHTNGFRKLRERLLPAFDLAFSGLVQDLEQRGLLDTTLVLAMGEFGRTPRINAEGGRDHHAGAWSVVLAGAGLKGGRVLGRTDRTGTEVTELPVTPVQLLAAARAITGGAAGARDHVLQALLAG